MIYMRNDKDFSEREIIAFKQLFGTEYNALDFGQIFSGET